MYDLELKELCAKLLKDLDAHGAQEFWRVFELSKSCFRLRRSVTRYFEARLRLIKEMQSVAYEIL